MERAAYLLALSRLEGVGTLTMRRLFEAIPRIESLFDNPESWREEFPIFYKRYADKIKNRTFLETAQKDIDLAREKGLSVITISDESYPDLLKECVDAPLFFFYKGNISAFESPHKLSIVGTRNATPYGRKMIESIVKELVKYIPDLVIVSGLAYGIDITAHRVALANKIPTIAVLAHGLDRVYPYTHRKEANQMLEKGGLLSEYPLGTPVERHQFVARNRIVAGLSPATLVIESAKKGGSLLTASMATDYYREVLALPGRATDKYSEGCNNLINRQQAFSVTSGIEIIHALGWSSLQIHNQSLREQSLFPEEVEQADPIIHLLEEEEAVHFNDLLIRLKQTPAKLSARLFDLEMEGKITALPGGKYTII